jgi:Malic enzyme, NAD binding domain
LCRDDRLLPVEQLTPVGETNNALVYPGIGLGTIVSKASHVTDRMLLAASDAIGGLVDVSCPGAGLLPEVDTCARCPRRSPWPSPSRRPRTAWRRPTSQIPGRPCRRRCGRRPIRALDLS